VGTRKFTIADPDGNEFGFVRDNTSVIDRPNEKPLPVR
jgi:hypothetical protein